MRGSSLRQGFAGLSVPGRRSFEAKAASPRMTRVLLLQMLRQEPEATRPGDIRARLVVACPFVAVKAVLRARIDVDLDIGPLGADGLDIAQRYARVLFAEMQLRRHFRLVVGKANDGAAVIADRR